MLLVQCSYFHKRLISAQKKKPIVFRSEKSHSKLGKLISILNRPLEVGLQRFYFLAGTIMGFLLILIMGLSPSSGRLTHTMEGAKKSLLKAQSDEKFAPPRAG